MLGVALFALAFLLGMYTYRAFASYNFSPLITVNNTTTNLPTTNGVAFGTFQIAAHTYQIQNSGITNTNDLFVRFQMSLDQTNWLNFAVYQPSITNAQTDTSFATGNSNITFYARAQVYVSNESTGIGIIVN